MSDMYLELRSRIPVVASRTIIGSTRLQDAQDRVGLSNESIARLIPVSEKTWRRWKEAGEIPTASLPAVARALRLDLIEAEAQPLATPSAPTGGDVAELRQEVERLRVNYEKSQDETQRLLAEIRSLLMQRQSA